MRKILFYWHLKSLKSSFYIQVCMFMRLYMYVAHNNYGKEKKDSYFNSFLRPHFIDLLKILLGSNSFPNYLISKKIRTQKCWFLSPWHHFFWKNIRQKKRGKKLHIYNFLKFILTTITKNDATSAKINFFEFWFFCWVGKLINYYSLKGF